LALPIGFLHSDKKGRNSLVWDAIEPLRPAIDKRVFDYIGNREFSRAEFTQFGPSTFRISRDVIGDMFGRVSLPESEITGAADYVLQLVERFAGRRRRLFKADLRRRKRASNTLSTERKISELK
jgi:CRISP-associated protein Cas1